MSIAISLPPKTRPLLLLRHGEARKDLPLRDRDRPLAPNGRDDIVRIAQQLRSIGLVPDWILCSPAQRTRETAALFREAAGIETEYLAMAALYHGHADEYLRTLQNLHLPLAPLLLVGHNPAISDLLFLLCPGLDDTISALPAGGVAVLATHASGWPAIGPDTVRFIRLLLPRELEGRR